jgi:hypothetical protein
MRAEDKAAWYRDIADQLWRISLDQSRDIRFEGRSRLASMAVEFEERAARLGQKMAAD